MEGTREIKRRIRSVKNIQQITRAMEMVAGARLRRAQAMAEEARPYAEKMRLLMKELVPSLAALDHPLLARREARRVAAIVITSDRGLCSAFNSNIIRKAVEFVQENEDKEVSLVLIGNKGNDFFSRRGYTIHSSEPFPFRRITAKDVKAVTDPLITDFGAKVFDEVHLFFSAFASVMRHVPTGVQLMPVERPEVEEQEIGEGTERFIFEPSKERLAELLLPRYVETSLYSAMLESMASEQGARMMAMRNATENAEEMIADLTLTYNKARQASITEELLEIVSGAEALKVG